jgi:hypothetical protein
MTRLLSRLLPLASAVLLLGGLTSTASACPFCAQMGQTLTGEVDMASMVLLGTLKANNENGDGIEGTTMMTVAKVIKDNDFLKGSTVVKLNRKIEPLPGQPKSMKYLVFCDIYKGNVDPYKGIGIAPDSDLPKYLEGALKHKGDKPAVRLRFFFDYLDNAEQEVSIDAYKEFAAAPYQDYRDMAKDLPADRIAHWLFDNGKKENDPKTPQYRYGLYASMLGHCGKPEHAKKLRELLDDPIRQSSTSSGTDGILAGYIMLDPKEGWSYLADLLKDAKKDFPTRYAALRTVRFFWDQRPDVVSKPVMLAGIRPLLEQNDIADLVIEDLRKWKEWSLTKEIMGLRDRKSHKVPIVQRAILRYALSCPQNSDAMTFVDTLRKKNPDMVKDAEEMLRIEISVPR